MLHEPVFLEACKYLLAEIESKGTKELMDDIHVYFPELFFALEKEFKHREKVRQLGVLLAGSM